MNTSSIEQGPANLTLSTSELLSNSTTARLAHCCYSEVELSGAMA